MRDILADDKDSSLGESSENRDKQSDFIKS